MKDKTLTDNDIVKALECCMDEMGCIKGCPCFNPKAKGSHYSVSKKLELEKLTLDIINRQKEEIERLKNAYEQVAWERDIFAEDMKEEIKKDCSYLMLDIKTIKAEAYKEFAERFVTELVDTYDLKSMQIGNIEKIKNNLLKEMEGEK